ncbi:UNVERIFIED_CONTAM: hypothetical protein Sradi_6950500 [Sesamum radiatum]|uniref:Uncharacterized protein n=1 Tax=Sesamum radiatum TaxID=300843 RepID=A0AAW2JG51_SESRA
MGFRECKFLVGLGSTSAFIMPRFYDSHNEGPYGRYVVPFSSHEILKMFCLAFSHDHEDSKRIMLLSVRPDPSIDWHHKRRPTTCETGNIVMLHRSQQWYIFSLFQVCHDS